MAESAPPVPREIAPEELLMTRVAGMWSQSIQNRAEAFFGTDFSSVRVRRSREPDALSAVALATGEDILISPAALDAPTRSGLALIGHELTHVIQQRSGRAGCDWAGVVDDSTLEAEADRGGAAFAEYCLSGRANVDPRPRALRPGVQPTIGVAQPKVWSPKEEVKPNDALFWHCTTFSSVAKLYDAPRINVKLGGGWQGPGFYVTTQRSDYVKIMALRNNQKDNEPLLFFLYLLVSDFYNLRGEFKDDFGTPTDPSADFVGVRWGGHIKGPFGKPEETIKAPVGSKARANLPKGHAIIGGYQGEELPTLGMKLDDPDQYNRATWYESTPTRGGRGLAYGGTGNWKDRTARQHSVLDRLWDLAQRNDRTTSTGSQELDLQVSLMGPRKALMMTLEELTFVSDRCADRIHIVGARVFASADTQTFFSDASPDFLTAQGPFQGNYSASSVDFDNDKWIDMDLLEEMILVKQGKAFVGAGTGSANKAPSTQDMLNRPKPPGRPRGKGV